MARNDENVFAEERKQLIVELVNRQVKATVSSLCEEFGVSPATIRNDLRELEFAGLLKRTHGGAIRNKKTSYEKIYEERLVYRKEEKHAIGKAAAAMVQDGDTIIMDTGTTTLEMARFLTDVQGLTVVTNDLGIASYINRHIDADLLVVGGFLRKHYNCFCGPLTISALDGLSVDKVFLSADGVSIEKGISTPNVDISMVRRAFIECADEKILLADHSKFGKTTFVKCADLSEVDVVVTDEKADKKYLSRMREEGVEIEIAKLPRQVAKEKEQDVAAKEA